MTTLTTAQDMISAQLKKMKKAEAEDKEVIDPEKDTAQMLAKFETHLKMGENLAMQINDKEKTGEILVNSPIQKLEGEQVEGDKIFDKITEKTGSGASRNQFKHLWGKLKFKDIYGGWNTLENDAEYLMHLRKGKNEFIMKALGQMIKEMFLGEQLSERRGKIYKYREHSPISAKEFKAILKRDENKNKQITLKNGAEPELFKWLIAQIEDTDERNDYYDQDTEFIKWNLPTPIYVPTLDRMQSGNERKLDLIKVEKISLSFEKNITFVGDGLISKWSDWFIIMNLKYKNEIMTLFNNYNKEMGVQIDKVNKEVEEIKTKAGKFLIVAQLSEKEEKE